MLTVLGEALIDLVADNGPGADTTRFTARPGGSPLNVAVGLARLGHETQFMARLADDAFGRILRGHASGNGVGLDSAAHAHEPSTLAVVSLDDKGHASYDFYFDGTADWQWIPTELTAYPSRSTVFHTGSLASWTPPGDEPVAMMARRLREEGDTLLTYDPNVRPRLLGEPARGRVLVERSVSIAHVVKASDEDLEFLYPDDDPLDVVRRWLDVGPSVVFLTRGAKGAMVRTAGGASARREPLPVQLVDSIGAGDAFMSGLISALVDRDLTDPSVLGELDAATLDTVLAEAGLVAALTVERAGAEPPTREQVESNRHRLGTGTAQ